MVKLWTRDRVRILPLRVQRISFQVAILTDETQKWRKIPKATPLSRLRRLRCWIIKFWYALKLTWTVIYYSDGSHIFSIEPSSISKIGYWFGVCHGWFHLQGIPRAMKNASQARELPIVGFEPGTSAYEANALPLSYEDWFLSSGYKFT